MRIKDYLIKRGIHPAIAIYAEHSLKWHAKCILEGIEPAVESPCSDICKPLNADVFKPRGVVK